MSKSIQLRKGTEKYYVHPYFPIGSIYINIMDIDPSVFFGGVWEKIQGRFLIGADDNVYKLGTTGGTTSHTHTNSNTGSTKLTISQIPSHFHGLNNHTHSVGAHSHGLNNHTHSYDKANSNTGSTTLTIDQIPSHNHGVSSPFYKFAELKYGVHGDVYKGDRKSVV